MCACHIQIEMHAVFVDVIRHIFKGKNRSTHRCEKGKKIEKDWKIYLDFYVYTLTLLNIIYT